MKTEDRTTHMFCTSEVVSLASHLLVYLVWLVAWDVTRPVASAR
jgi:hypothetical protein